MPTPLISLWRGYRDASLILRVTIALVLGVAVGLIGSAIIGHSEGERIATQEPAGSEAASRRAPESGAARSRVTL